MATVKVVQKKEKTNAKGEAPLYIRIIKDRKVSYISLQIYISPDLWDEARSQVKKGYPNSVRVNALISKKIAEAQGVELDTRNQAQYTSSHHIKETLKGKRVTSILQRADDYITQLKSQQKIGTYKRIKAVLEKLRTYLKGKDLLFQEFDVAFLKKYESYLRDELHNTQNTAHANLKVFRKLFNDAIREEIIDARINPFLKYRVQTERIDRGYLLEKEVLAIKALELPEQSRLYHYRNLFVFACYAGGIRISDLLCLKWKNYNGTHIRLLTKKTRENISVKLPTQAQEIIKLYADQTQQQDDNHFIFPLLQNDEDYSDPAILYTAISRNTARINKGMKIIAKSAGIEKQISFHHSRHSFATNALIKGIKLEQVSKLMGHNSIKTTQIYAKITSSELDKAMDAFG